MQYRKSIRYYHFIINAFNHNSLLTTKISNQELIHEIIFHILKYLNFNSISHFKSVLPGIMVLTAMNHVPFLPMEFYAVFVVPVV